MYFACTVSWQRKAVHLCRLGAAFIPDSETDGSVVDMPRHSSRIERDDLDVQIRPPNNCSLKTIGVALTMSTSHRAI